MHTTWLPLGKSSRTVAIAAIPEAKAKPRVPPSKRREAALVGEAGGILGARILEAFVDAGAFLGVGAGEENRRHHRAGHRLGALATMDAKRSEGERVVAHERILTAPVGAGS